MNTKRILAALLASLMLVPAMASCSDDSGVPADTTAAAETTVPAETEPKETERHEIKDDLPTDLKFDGKTFSIYVATQAVHDNFVMGKAEKEGDIVNDAVWERNANVQEQLNITLKATPNANTYKDVATAISTLILAGDSSYDIYMGHQYGMTSLVSQKVFVDANTMKYINFDQPWWMTTFMDELTLGKGSRYLLVSDFNTQVVSYIRANFFNKTLYEKLYGDPNELYKLTLDGKFTLDHMNKLIAGSYKDLNGDGAVDEKDQLGLACNQLLASVDSFVFGSHVKFTTRDKDGYVQLNMKTDDAVKVVEQLCAFFNQQAIYTKTGGKQNAVFAEGNTLFLGNGMLSAAESTELRGMEDDFGVLPHPKTSEDQEYFSLVHDTALLTGVSVAGKNLEMTGAVLEALAAESYRRVTPAWYEGAMKLKYSRDDISSQMIDLIKDSMATDFIFAYNSTVNGMGQIFRTLISQNKPDNYISTVDSKIAAAEAGIADLVKAFKAQ